MTMEHSTFYQVFVGRNPRASAIEHDGRVFEQMAQFSWQELIQHRSLDTIYLLGVFDNRGPIIVKEERGIELSPGDPDRMPSPFALRDHKRVNPRWGTDESFAALIESIHRPGGKVIVDFVPNHTGLAHPWLVSHRAHYATDMNSRDGLRYEFSGDVAKLDYRNQGLVDAQIDVLRSIAARGVDGVRCDMAQLVPLDFWREAIRSVREEFPRFFFLAEAYPENVFDWSPVNNMIDAGFDAVYHDSFYKNVEQVIGKGAPLSYLSGHLNYFLQHPHRERLVHYLANHDDSMAPGVVHYQPALVALMFCLPGMPLLFNGQLNGCTDRLAHHYYDELSEGCDELISVPAWFQDIGNIRSQFRPLIFKTEPISGGMLRCCCKTNEGTPATLLLNLGPSGQPLPADIEITSKGRLQGLTREGRLECGCAELFLG